MSQDYRIVVQYKTEAGDYDSGTIVKEGTIDTPETIMELGLRHIEQIEILRRIQGSLLAIQSVNLQADITFCPVCGNKLVRHGITRSSFNAVFTDHKVGAHRLICKKCRWSSVPSIKSLFGTHMHPDLLKLQCETAAQHTYKETETILNQKSCQRRAVNNATTARYVVEHIGEYISGCQPSGAIKDVEPAKELTIQIDGGHIKSKNKEERSFEAMTSVVYKPDSVKHNPETNRGYITSKDCAASALDDDNGYIMERTLYAASKQGLTKDTHLTALCDGAKNCWNIVSSLEPHCAEVTRILDWFHIGMRFKTISLAEKHQELLDKAKWHVWHGNADKVLLKLEQIAKLIRSQKNRKKILKLQKYLDNNKEYLVDYRERQKQGLAFTSQMAESTVESLINRRCKGRQHMRWSRKGVHPLLQIRAVIASNEWISSWEQYVMGAYAKAA